MRVAVFLGSSTGSRPEYVTATAGFARALSEAGIGIWTWHQLGLHAKPIALLDVGAFWDGLTELVDKLARDGFVPAESRRYLVRVGSAHQLLRLFASD